MKQLLIYFLKTCSDYTVSYHQLMRFLAKNFDQKSILRVVKSLAAFRPSLIALQYVATNTV